MTTMLSAQLILASASTARQTMLRSAGIDCAIVPSRVNEEEIRATMLSDSDCVEAADIAMTLAIEKALSIARDHPGAHVIGADQVLAIGRHFISKAENMAEARETLDRLRGRTHELVSAVAIARDRDVIWSDFDSATLTMRQFSDEFLGHYLERAGGSVLNAVGCYEIEGLGAQLFEEIDGDHSTILGMPLFPLLRQLRHLGLITA